VIPIPRVALVGRPNVGKSTLFNRIAGRRKAITDGRPGSTRDRNYAQASWRGAAFELIDTGGLLIETDDPLLRPAAEQAERAMDEAALLLFIVDARAGLLPDDAALASRVRKFGKPVLLVVNKAEADANAAVEFSRLGFGEAYAISAEHGHGIGELLDASLSMIPRVEEAAEGRERPTRIALVGRPNVGKSSILNRLVGHERAIVSPIPGTTRDAVDSLITRKGTPYLLVDTAGIRRPRLLKEGADHVSVVLARRSVERADVAVLVLDAAEGPRDMDATIAGDIQHAGRAVVLALNKWDAVRDRKLSPAEIERAVREHIKFLTHAPLIRVSAQTGLGLDALLAAAERARRASRSRVSTGQLNRLLAAAAKANAPKAAKGNHPVRILYGTQVGLAPPTFVLSLSHPVDLHFSYKRYLENKIRSAFGFEGTPIVLKCRVRPH
jgi:GTP-binding protein